MALMDPKRIRGSHVASNFHNVMTGRACKLDEGASMFQTLRNLLSGSVTLNGVKLPSEFNSGTIVEGVALSRDGKRCATVSKEGALVTAEVPSDGIVQINGQVVQFDLQCRSSRVFGSRISIEE